MERKRKKKIKSSVDSVMEYKERKAQKRKRIGIGILSAICFGAAIIVIVIYGLDHLHYDAYQVVKQADQEDAVSNRYVEFGDYILKYGGDGITLQNNQEEEIWDVPQTMDSPQVETCEESCIVYDKNSSVVTVFDLNGQAGTIETGMPIKKAKVSGQGVVAVILEDGETTWIKVYEKDGTELVTMKTSVDNPGYPLDLSIAPDGMLLAVSYLKVEGSQPVSHLLFYNFGNAGQTQMDNVVSEYTYEDTLIPQLEYVSDTRAIAFRDDGFSIYDGKQIPEETKNVKTEEEILATFCSKSYVGMVFRETDGEHPYRMDVYNKKGTLWWSEGVAVAFDRVAVSKDQILLYNDKEFAIYTEKGVCRYSGSLKENRIQTMFKTDRNRYLIVTDTGTETIKLK